MENGSIKYIYSATVINIVDGDTVDLLIDVGFNIKIEERVRLLGIDAPERFTPEGKLATAKLEAHLLLKEISVRTVKHRGDQNKKGKYGRYLGDLIYRNQSVSDWMVEQGLALYKDY